MTGVMGGAPQRVAIVTGGGAGIGAAVAEELGRRGTFVVTMDPLVTVDGAEQLPKPEETTAGRITAAGGSSRASSVSVTDRDEVRRLFAEVAGEFGGLDAVVNVAGISRPTSFARGTDEDWRSVLSVHLDGYRNILDASLPIMAAAGRGHILGVTSGSGWRAADTGAYGCAKRAVASLTWQLGRQAPPGVIVNAMSPIAMTRMVTNALKGRRPPSTKASGSAATGGLSLGSMPEPEEIGPFAAHLVGAGFSACRGRVLFAAGSEVAVIDEPRLLEMFGVDPSGLAGALEVLTPGALVPAEAHQQSGGGSNARFATMLAGSLDRVVPVPEVRTCAVVADGSEVADACVAALEARAVTCLRVPGGLTTGFDEAAEALASLDGSDTEVDCVVIAPSSAPPVVDVGSEWERILAEHAGIVDAIHTDAAWSRAVADLAARTHRAIRMVTLTDANSAAGRSRAQASAQLARAARGATEERVTAFSVSIEDVGADNARAGGGLAAHLLASPDTTPLSGAELVVKAGSIGLRSHPRVNASLVIGAGAVPGWLDDALTDIVGPGGF